MSYRLETPRSRPPPPPLRHPTPRSSIHINIKSNTTLLYDLPSSPSVSSPPTSPVLPKHGSASPSSPSFPGGRARGRRGGRTGPIPPARNRSSTPLGVSQSDLEKFTDICRAWYFDQDEAAGRIMTQTLANVAPSQRALYSRLQASVRSAFHASVNARRHAEFQAHISATQPGGSLMPHSRANPSDPMARKERFERLDRFVRTWCTMGMPGTKPFFEALWAVMRLQALPGQLGGAGGNRIRWELDDAVFKEAAGKDFMLEAIDVLKGVLAFEELPSLGAKCLNYDSRPGSSSYPNGKSNPSYTLSTFRSPKPSPISMVTHSKRARAPSDPFLDMPPLSHSLPSASSHSSSVALPLPPCATDNSDDGARSVTPNDPDGDEEHQLAPLRSELPTEETDDVYLRIWTTPDLPNPEYVSLLNVFPSFVTRGSPPRFPVSRHPRANDIEEVEDERGEGKEIRYGTGTMWVSTKQRSDGYKGSWWTRFVQWWRRLFC